VTISGDDGGPSGDDAGQSCPKGKTACNGACVDLNASAQNCGACGNACPPEANAAAGCNSGRCGITCSAGFLDCDGNPSNGCEVNENTDLANCGSCNNACPLTPKHATAACAQGVCGIQCDQGSADCNHDPSDGCEVDTTSDPSNCGACGNQCGINTACVNSICILPNSSYPASKTFTDALTATTMTLAWDGTNYWSCSGGSQSGVRYAQYDANGTMLHTYSPNIDFRSIVTVNGSGSTVYAREYASPIVHQQTSPGTFTNGRTLNGGPLDSQSSVVFNPSGTEYDAMYSGTVTRWDSNGGLLGTVTLTGFGNNFSENSYPQNGRIIVRGVYLTYSNGNLTAWTLAGARIKSTVLTGGGTSFDSHFSLSYANGMVWVVDVAGGTWRGYNVGL
jgi:hypothetical protein